MSSLWRKVHRPLVWGWLYVLAIPVFSFLIWLNSASFLVGNTTIGPQYLNELKTIESQLEVVFREAVSRYCSDCDSDFTSFAIGQRAKRKAGFHGFLSIKRPRIVSHLLINYRVVPERKIPTDLVIRDEDELDKYLTGRRVLKVYLDPSTYPSGHRISFRDKGFSVKEDRSSLEIDNVDPELITILDGLSDREDGIHNETSISVTSAAYLSVVTITTLGFGDIVPITDTGRFIVAAEAIIGVLLMGLFLTSLGGRGGKRTEFDVAGPNEIQAFDEFSDENTNNLDSTDAPIDVRLKDTRFILSETFQKD